MAQVRVYERAGGGEELPAPSRFGDLDAAKEALRPGSLVCLTSAAGDEVLVARGAGACSGGAPPGDVRLVPTGWSSRGGWAVGAARLGRGHARWGNRSWGERCKGAGRWRQTASFAAPSPPPPCAAAEINGWHTWAQGYPVESLPCGALFLVVRNGSSIGFSALGSDGRMLSLGPGGVAQLSQRTPATWSSSEAFVLEEGKLLNLRRRHECLQLTPLHVTALPTMQLQRAEEHWGKQVRTRRSAALPPRCYRAPLTQVALPCLQLFEAQQEHTAVQQRLASSREREAQATSAVADAAAQVAEATKAAERWQREAEQLRQALTDAQHAQRQVPPPLCLQLHGMACQVAAPSQQPPPCPRLPACRRRGSPARRLTSHRLRCSSPPRSTSSRCRSCASGMSATWPAWRQPLRSISGMWSSTTTSC